MKIIYGLLFSLSLGLSLFAQPVLDTSYFPKIGKAFSGRSYYKVTPISDIPEGANQTWNLLGLDSVYITEYSFGFRVKSVANTDSGSKFPGAQVAMLSYFGTDSVENFYKYNGNDLEVLGFNVKGVPWNEKFVAPLRVEFRSGLDFEDQLIRTSRSVRYIGGLRTYHRYRDTIRYAGYGTVITTFGTFNNVPLIKLNYSIDQSFSPQGPLQLNNYGRHWLWYLPGYGQPYIRYNEDVDVNVPDAVRYEGYVGYPIVGNKKRIGQTQAFLFPSHLQAGEYLQFSEEISFSSEMVRIFDLQGKQLPTAFEGNRKISTKAWNPGLYLIHIQNRETISTQKIVVE
jgi:hypothetical protein